MLLNANRVGMLGVVAAHLALSFAHAQGLPVLAEANPLGAAAPAQKPPLIERVEPTAGPPGTLVRISGRRLRGDTRVLLGETGLSVQVSSPNLLTARVEKGSATATLRVHTVAGDVLGPVFTVTAEALAPIIERVLPLRAAPASTVTIYGRHFSPRLAQNEVLFGTTPAIVSAVSAEPGTTPERAAARLRVIVPAGAGSVPLTVRVLPDGEARSPQPFEILRGLSIDAVWPVRVAPSAKVELRGSGFDSSVNVYLGELRLRVIDASAGKLTVAIPANARSGVLRVESKLAGKAQSSTLLEVVSPPELKGFSPLLGPVGSELLVRGSGFGENLHAVSARLGDAALIVERVTPSELSLRVPAAAVSGKLSIRVAEYPELTAPTEFLISEALAVTGMKPMAGPAGSEVVIEGRGFSLRLADDHVSLGDVPVEVLRATSNELTVRVPDVKSGPFNVQVGAAGVETRRAFILTHPALITGVSAEELATDSELTVFGAGFGHSAALVQVTLGGQTLRVFKVTNNKIVTRTPTTPVAGELTVHVALQGATSYASPIRAIPR